jgi:hypothetical protein
MWGTLPPLASFQDWYSHFGKQPHELPHVALVGRDARHLCGGDLGVVEGDQHLLVLGFGDVDPRAGMVQRVRAHRGVVGGDVADDPHVQLLPQRLGEHGRVLIPDARQISAACTGARDQRPAHCSDSASQAGEQRSHGAQRNSAIGSTGPHADGVKRALRPMLPGCPPGHAQGQSVTLAGGSASGIELTTCADRQGSWYVPVVLRKPLKLIPPLLLAALAPFLIATDQSFSRASAATPHWAPTGARRPAVVSRSHVPSVSAVSSGPSVQVTLPPVGLSIEYPVLAEDLGTGACPRAALVAELLRLGSPPLALAGASQDLTAPSGALTGPPSSWETATLYTLPGNFWSQLHCLLSATKDPLTVGINAKSGELSWATQMVASAQSAATNGLDFSLGNEPDLYVLPNYPSLGKKLSEQENLVAVKTYVQLATYLKQAIGSFALLGPELATAQHWQRQLPGVIEQLHERTVGVHRYPFSACKDPRAATIRGLLSARAAEAPRSLAWVVADARAAGVPPIISEANSVSCGGIAGVSDSPAAAVWAVRFVLSALKTGFREVRFHISGGSYDPFFVRGEAVVARPLESALVALNQWLPVGSSLRTVTGVRGLVTTAVSGDPRGPRAILYNEQARAQTVVLAAAHPVVVEVLSAARAGLLTETLRASHGRVKLRVAGNTVVAVLS